MESIGTVLSQERERRGLSLEEVHDATKITVTNLSALEEDRFDSFPNKVYARAFLRDYANYLSLDSLALLTQYEDEWTGSQKTEEPLKKSKPVWRIVGYSFLTLVITATLAVGGYFGWEAYQEKASRISVGRRIAAKHKGDKVAELPKAPLVTPAKPETSTKPKAKQDIVPAPVPDKLTLEVTPLRDVWVGVKSDGKTAYMNTLPKGATKTFEAKKSISIRVGQGNAVQVKLNGKPQPPLGTMSNPITKEFNLPKPQPNTTPANTSVLPNAPALNPAPKKTP